MQALAPSMSSRRLLILGLVVNCTLLRTDGNPVGSGEAPPLFSDGWDSGWKQMVEDTPLVRPERVPSDFA